MNWVIKLEPRADISLKIDALGHDIERYDNDKLKRKDFDDYEKYKERHALRSAEILCDLMKKYRFDDETIKRTRFLVINHEVGGRDDADILRDADSLSFFDNNVYSYWKTHNAFFKDKIMFMYKRMSQRGKRLFKDIKFKDKLI